jgi:hypothetical protein
MMHRPFTAPRGGIDLSAGVQVMTLAAMLQTHSQAFMLQLRIAAAEDSDDSAAFAALEAARAALDALRSGLEQLRTAARPLMASDPELARTLEPLLASPDIGDACGDFAAMLARSEEQVRRARLGRTVIGRA